MQNILEIQNLKKYYPITKGAFRRVVGQVKAVDDVSLSVPKGEIMGLVGESGCGKTTLGHCVMQGHKVTAGSIFFNDKDLGRTDIANADKATIKQVRRNLQMIFQDPFSSLNPRMNVLNTVAEPLLVNGLVKNKELEKKVAELLEVVGLRAEHMYRFPHAFSGGQRQRIGVARALAMNPQMIVADEPVSALDVSIQAQTLNLLKELRAKLNVSILFIAHDLSVVEHISDRVAVMYVGKVVETADTLSLFYKPRHPYTEALLSSVPRPDPKRKKKRILLKGEVPSPANPPSGCAFHPRCKYATDLCSKELPTLQEIAPSHKVACHYAKELSLQGALA